MGVLQRGRLYGELRARRATLLLTASFVLVYVMQWVVARTWGEGVERLVFHRIHDFPLLFWGYLTSIFSHKLSDPLGHFGFNTMIMLAVGAALEPRIGGKHLGFAFVLAGVLSGIVQGIVERTEVIDHSLGASGGLAGLGALLILTRARFDPWMLPRAWWYALHVVVALLFVALWAGIVNVGPSIGHTSHLVGYLVGTAYGGVAGRTGALRAESNA